MEDQGTPRPLDAEEIKTGIAQMVADAVYDQLTKTCNLFGKAYPKFKGWVQIHLELDDFGIVTEDNSLTNIQQGEVSDDAAVLNAKLDIEELPPNQFRMETDQPIVKTVIEDGKPVQKKIKYQPKKKRAAGRANK
jgi:hypothetical protein